LADVTDRSSSVSAYARRLAATLVLALAAAAFLAGCGSSSSTSAASSSSSSTAAAASSTPAYCSDVNNFKSAVAQLKDTGSPAAIVTKVATSGQLAISAVKTAFASQVGALKSSLTALTNTATQLTSSSTRASALHQVPGEVTAVKAAAGKFVDATKCG
jgi:ABC-type oligopeptide transport system substrate-binding subunit